MGGVGKHDDDTVNGVVWLFVASGVVACGVLVIKLFEVSRGSSKSASINVLWNIKK